MSPPNVPCPKCGTMHQSNFCPNCGEAATAPHMTDIVAPPSQSDVAPAVKNYDCPVSAVAGVIPASDTSLSVAYEPHEYTLTIKYQMKDGSTAFDSLVRRLPYKGNYSFDSPVLSGFTPNRSRVSVIMPGYDLTIVVIYQPPKSPFLVMLEDATNDLFVSVSSNAFMIVGVCLCLLSVVINIILVIRVILEFSKF